MTVLALSDAEWSALRLSTIVSLWAVGASLVPGVSEPAGGVGPTLRLDKSDGLGAIWIHILGGVVEGVGVSIPALRIGWISTVQNRVDRRKPPLPAVAVSGPEVVQSRPVGGLGLDVACLAGEAPRMRVGRWPVRCAPRRGSWCRWSDPSAPARPSS